MSRFYKAYIELDGSDDFADQKYYAATLEELCDKVEKHFPHGGFSYGAGSFTMAFRDDTEWDRDQSNNEVVNVTPIFLELLRERNIIPQTKGETPNEKINNQCT